MVAISPSTQEELVNSYELGSEDVSGWVVDLRQV